MFAQPAILSTLVSRKSLTRLDESTNFASGTVDKRACVTFESNLKVLIGLPLRDWLGWCLIARSSSYDSRFPDPS